jgi:hypothetical protein
MSPIRYRKIAPIHPPAPTNMTPARKQYLPGPEQPRVKQVSSSSPANSRLKTCMIIFTKYIGRRLRVVNCLRQESGGGYGPSLFAERILKSFPKSEAASTPPDNSTRPVQNAFRPFRRHQGADPDTFPICNIFRHASKSIRCALTRSKKG